MQTPAPHRPLPEPTGSGFDAETLAEMACRSAAAYRATGRPTAVTAFTGAEGMVVHQDEDGAPVEDERGAPADETPELPVVRVEPLRHPSPSIEESWTVIVEHVPGAVERWLRGDWAPPMPPATTRPREARTRRVESARSPPDDPSPSPDPLAHPRHRRRRCPVCNRLAWPGEIESCLRPADGRWGAA